MATIAESIEVGFQTEKEIIKINSTSDTLIVYFCVKKKTILVYFIGYITI